MERNSGFRHHCHRAHFMTLIALQHIGILKYLLKEDHLGQNQKDVSKINKISNTKSNQNSNF